MLNSIFLIFIAIFVYVKIGLADVVGFLQNNKLVVDIPILGIIPVFGYAIFFIILYNQEQRIKKTELNLKHLGLTKRI